MTNSSDQLNQERDISHAVNQDPFRRDHDYSQHTRLETSAETEDTQSSLASLDTLPTDEFLKIVGLRVRAQRATTGMSRKRLAEVSGVSERYLAQLESGQGNMSIALLRKVTRSIGMSLATLLSADIDEKTHSANQDHQSSNSVSSHTNGATTHQSNAGTQHQRKLVPEL